MVQQRTGYSGKPLYQKLGIKDTHKVLFYDEPPEYHNWLEIPFDLQFVDGGELADFVHVFCKEKVLLEKYVQECVGEIQQNGMIWISWPKKASKVTTDITEDTIRQVVFPLGLVDIKVCSVSDIWSGLKVVIRKENRK